MLSLTSTFCRESAHLNFLFGLQKQEICSALAMLMEKSHVSVVGCSNHSNHSSSPCRCECRPLDMMEWPLACLSTCNSTLLQVKPWLTYLDRALLPCLTLPGLALAKQSLSSFSCGGPQLRRLNILGSREQQLSYPSVRQVQHRAASSDGGHGGWRLAGF